MRPRMYASWMIFALLALTACTQSLPARGGQTMPEVIKDPVSSQNIEGESIRNTGETLQLINMVAGYCLHYPAQFDVAFFKPNNIMFFKSSILNVSEPNLRIDVLPAGGMTVDQAADKIVEDYAVPGEEVPKVELSLGGEKAIMLDGLSGQDPNRQVVVLHKDSLYTLFFIQMDKDQPEQVALAEALYDTVVASFNFRPETNFWIDCQPLPDSVEDQS
jgi:hypothetical protein